MGGGGPPEDQLYSSRNPPPKNLSYAVDPATMIAESGRQCGRPECRRMRNYMEFIRLRGQENATTQAHSLELGSAAERYRRNANLRTPGTAKLVFCSPGRISIRPMLFPTNAFLR